MTIEWTPITKALPRDGKSVFVTRAGGCVDRAIYWENRLLDGERGAVWELDGELTRDVIAWVSSAFMDRYAHNASGGEPDVTKCFLCEFYGP